MKLRELRLDEKKSEMEVLKKNRIELDPEERKQVMKAGAVWHHGPGQTPSAAVWKSKDSHGKIKYVCNTHRAYQVSSTLKGSIKDFDFIKTTS